MNSRIGFMQGRLSPMAQGKIQSFPWNSWENEFLIARNIGLSLMEWTIDSKNFVLNPILVEAGLESISNLAKLNSVQVSSVTSDYFMENPPWKEDFKEVAGNHRNICKGMKAIGAKYLVIPLVDNSSLSNKESEKDFLNFMTELENTLREFGITVAIESDYDPMQLQFFISQFNPEIVGINYDIGNSASFGFDPCKEIEAFGNRIVNVHVKDRKLGGSTVPLGTGNADLPETIKMIEASGYGGNYILQTARATGEKHAEVIIEYSKMMEEWLYASK